MAKCLRLAQSSLCKTMLVRYKTSETVCKCGNQCKKDFRTGKNESSEKTLVQWFQHMRADNVSTDGYVLHA